MVVRHADQLTSPMPTRYFHHRVTGIGAAVLDPVKPGQRVRVVVIVSWQTHTARVDDEQIRSPTHRARHMAVTAGQQSDVLWNETRQSLFNLCRACQSGRIALGCFQQILHIAAGTAVTQRHIFTQLLRPKLRLVQPRVRRISVGSDPIFGRCVQLSRCVGIRQILPLGRRAQHLALMVACHVQPRKTLESPCGFKWQQRATQGVTQIHHTLNLPMPHIGHHRIQRCQIPMNIRNQCETHHPPPWCCQSCSANPWKNTFNACIQRCLSASGAKLASKLLAASL